MICLDLPQQPAYRNANPSAIPATALTMFLDTPV
jgi:hypothetical protein